MSTEAIRFYCGVSETVWNHHPVAPGGYACIAPVYGSTVASKRVASVWIPPNTLTIQDSSAFSDGPGQRLSPEAALDRQIQHAETYDYSNQITHRASYDLLIDERWAEGRRKKERWTENEAEFAVKITIKAAEYLNKNRQSGIGCIMSAQGVTPRQYLKCTQQVVPFMAENDIFGVGGWCILGKKPGLLPVFRETMRQVIPFIARAGIKRAHIWGVCYAPGLAEILALCDEYGVALSTDSVGPSIRPARGQWGYAGWINHNYVRPEPEIRGLERARHVQAVRDWLANFRDTHHYKTVLQEHERQRAFQQLSFFEGVA